MDQPSDSGCLIDLDHAKKGKPVQDQVQLPHNEESIDKGRATFRFCTEVDVEREVARLWLKYPQGIPEGEAKKQRISYTMEVVAYALEFRDFTKDRLLTAQDLRWKQVRPTSLPHSFAHFCQPGSSIA